jgi:hypothetical protein
MLTDEQEQETAAQTEVCALRGELYNESLPC